MNDRKRQVLLTAQQLFVQNGFFSTTIQDILDAAQISKGTFYNYFSSKNECLTAILIHGHEEIFVRRQELLIGQDLSDKAVLAEQILIRFQVNREQNLIPIFQAIFHSGDLELRAFVSKHHFEEISWLSNRFIDVYGETATPVSFDSAVLLLGMIQQSIHVLKVSSRKEIDTTEVINYTMRRIDSMITNMIETNDVFFHDEVFAHLDKNIDILTYTKQQLHAQLMQFHKVIGDDALPDSKQHIHFIMDEIDSEYPRILILESVLRSFREYFAGTLHEHEAQELATNIWGYIDALK